MFRLYINFKILSFNIAPKRGKLNKNNKKSRKSVCPIFSKFGNRVVLFPASLEIGLSYFQKVWKSVCPISSKFGNPPDSRNQRGQTCYNEGLDFWD